MSGGEVASITASAAATEAVAKRLGAALEGGELLLLQGGLGAGKTCFVRGLARGLGVPERRVKSPTYNVMHRHEGGRAVLDHYDAYFVREAEEFVRMGLLEALAEGHVAAVEWADRWPKAFPADRLQVALEPLGPDERRVRLVAYGPRASALLERFCAAGGFGAAAAAASRPSPPEDPA